MNQPENELSFEDAVARLEQIVTALETGNQPLSQCLAQYEEAVNLCRHCSGLLGTAELRIQTLTAESGLQPSDLQGRNEDEAICFD